MLSTTWTYRFPPKLRLGFRRSGDRVAESDVGEGWVLLMWLLTPGQFYDSIH